MLLTVIVPVYNVERYLARCVESILHQNYSKLDVILIDDGSTDGSGEMCDRYAKMDERVKVIHCKNSGVVSSRVKGLECASGEVVTFVDSDDWIEPDMYSCMMDVYRRHNPDIVSSGLIIEDETGRVIQQEFDLYDKGMYLAKQIREVIVKEMMWSEDYGKRRITSSVCNKIFKLEMLKWVTSDIDVNLTIGEDAAITYPYIARSRSIFIINRGWYHYVKRRFSMISAHSLKSFEAILKFKNYMKKIFVYDEKLDDIAWQLQQYVNVFLLEVINGVYEVEMEKIRFVFPYELIPAGSNIVLYGMGQVGTSYWHCLHGGEYINQVICVDKNYNRFTNEQMTIYDPAVIYEKDYDYIVIAVENEDWVKEIRENLLKNNICEKKIVWKKPKRII